MIGYLLYPDLVAQGELAHDRAAHPVTNSTRAAVGVGCEVHGDTATAKFGPLDR